MSRTVGTKRVVSLCLLFVLAISTVAVTGAFHVVHAQTEQPWDRAGSAWEGTIDISKTINDSTDGGGTSRFQATATYTDLVPLNETADGGYKAKVVTSGSQSSTSPCDNGGNFRFSQTWTDHQVPMTGMDSYPPLQLVTDDDGHLFFTPLFVDAGSHPYENSGCYGEHNVGDTVLDSGILTFGLRWANSVDAEVPVPDMDPDPLRYVGSRTWSNGDYPYRPYWEVDEYSYTVTYDLTLVTVPFECDVTKTKSRRWSAKTPVRALPDKHWGDYKVTVEWCHDSRDPGRGKITSIRSRGTVDDGPFGLFSRAAGFFGFTTEWENQKCEPTQDPQCGDISSHDVRLASVTRKMAFCFNFAKLIDKIGIKGWLEGKVKPRLTSRLDDFIRRNGSLTGDELDTELLGFVDEIIAKALTKVDLVDEVLRDKHVPNFLAKWIEDQVEEPFQDLVASWRDDVTDQLTTEAYKDMLAEQATDAVIDPFIDTIFNILRVCDGGAFLFGKDYPGLLALWQPEVTVNLLADGRLDWTRIDLYKHPLLKVERV